MKRILIGGTHSGCGKTTVTCAILRALQMRGLKVSSFKCGPDYIDPMFHREIIGSASANLDGFFCEPETLRQLLRQGSAGTDIAVIEGVMGYFDGMKTGGSAYDIARLTDTSAVIVVNARGMSESLGAIMEGFVHYRQDARICGFIFNQLPASLVGSAREMCTALNMAFVGYLPKHDISLESRNLGLVTAAEIPDLREKTEKLGALAAEHIDLELLLELAECGPGECRSAECEPEKCGPENVLSEMDYVNKKSVRRSPEADETAIETAAGTADETAVEAADEAANETAAEAADESADETTDEAAGEAADRKEPLGGRIGDSAQKNALRRTDGPVIAVARDMAFCFRYPENIRLLESLGGRIVYFSPMYDAAVPAQADGLYLCGGYPELHARELSENTCMRRSVRQVVEGGMPTIAECGGFLYLHRELRIEDTADGTAAETVGAPGTEPRSARTDGGPEAEPGGTELAGRSETESGDAGAAASGGKIWPMTGVLNAAAFPRKSLRRFGYITMTAQADNLLCEKGEQIRAHEFHYWDSTDPGELFAACKQDGRRWLTGIGTENLYAGFPHLYFPARPQMALRFVKRCREYGENRWH